MLVFWELSEAPKLREGLRWASGEQEEGWGLFPAARSLEWALLYGETGSAGPRGVDSGPHTESPPHNNAFKPFHKRPEI